MTRRFQLLLPLLALALAVGCREADARPPRAAEASEAPMLAQRGTATLTTLDGRQFKLEVEIASNDHDRARGLMFRKSMPEMAGMVFVFPEEEVRAFWMKNTLLPLDMLFIAGDGTILGIVENAEPLTTTSRSVDANAKYVFEVNGGWSARHGVVRGDKFALEGKFDLR